MMKTFSKKTAKSFFICSLFTAYCIHFLAAQTPSVIENVRIPLWADLDAYPEVSAEIQKKIDRDTDANSLIAQYKYPIERMKETAPFIINGMVYGWSFVYTPKDNIRKVEEYLEVEEISSSDLVKRNINYSSPWIENNRFNCWCEYTRTDAQIQNYNLWSSIQNPIISGRGYGAVSKGFEGLREAAQDALRAAIRSYYRNLIKNKPKQITGSVLVRNIPTIGVDSGRYVINLDFFLESGKITQYNVY